MPWFKVDDAFWGHPKRLSCPPAAVGLWVTAGSWSAQQMTDGHVPRHVLGVLGGKLKDASALVAAGLWDVTPGGWRFHDWDDMQPTRAQTQARRADDSERKRLARAEKEAKRQAGRLSVRPESEPCPPGRRPESDACPPGIRAASALPDPTRPDPTRSGSTLREDVDVDVPPDDTDLDAIRTTIDAAVASWGLQMPTERRTS